MPVDWQALENFTFIDPGPLSDGDLELLLNETCPAIVEKGFVPEYKFHMIRPGTKVVMGSIQLRVALTEKLEELGGHIGYEVYSPYRGQHYAARSCRLLFPLLRRLAIDPVVITCDPQNTPSVKTIESLGGQIMHTKVVEIEPGINRWTSVYHLSV